MKLIPRIVAAGLIAGSTAAATAAPVVFVFSSSGRAVLLSQAPELMTLDGPFEIRLTGDTENVVTAPTAALIPVDSATVTFQGFPPFSLVPQSFTPRLTFLSRQLVFDLSLASSEFTSVSVQFTFLLPDTAPDYVLGSPYDLRSGALGIDVLISDSATLFFDSGSRSGTFTSFLEPAAAVIPVPGAAGFLMAGLLGLGVLARRRPQA